MKPWGGRAPEDSITGKSTELETRVETATTVGAAFGTGNVVFSVYAGAGVRDGAVFRTGTVVVSVTVVVPVHTGTFVRAGTAVRTGSAVGASAVFKRGTVFVTRTVVVSVCEIQPYFTYGLNYTRQSVSHSWNEFQGISTLKPIAGMVPEGGFSG